ncbi:MAG: WXG100 family type VII secretion target [Actinomycetota bacterium]|nr:WXG100 family type VII secretion target [Actinomycetota bacterium]
MSTIKVTSEQLSTTASSLSSGEQEIAGKLSQLHTQVQALVDADWQGAASGSFNELWMKWHQGSLQVQEALQGISQMLGKAGQVYQQTEDQLANQLRA